MLEISGLEIAGGIIERLKSETTPKKILAAVLVGKNPASISFLKQKERTAKELGVDPVRGRPAIGTATTASGRSASNGVDFRLHEFPEDIKNDDLRREVG